MSKKYSHYLLLQQYYYFIVVLNQLIVVEAPAISYWYGTVNVNLSTVCN